MSGRHPVEGLAGSASCQDAPNLTLQLRRQMATGAFCLEIPHRASGIDAAWVLQRRRLFFRWLPDNLRRTSLRPSLGIPSSIGRYRPLTGLHCNYFASPFWPASNCCGSKYCAFASPFWPPSRCCSSKYDDLRGRSRLRGNSQMRFCYFVG